MSIGANVSVVTAGAILAFAVRVRTEVVSVHAVGAVLMAVGVIGLMLQLRALARQRQLTSVQVRQPMEGVLVRPSGPAQSAYPAYSAYPEQPAQAPYTIPGTTADPLPPGESPYRSAPEYGGNEW
ncbi:hypothetical protein KDL01_28065 [Actinospica durhamensis]|uniref:Uncharacterized protein n=1 Tax=Actinospica durhamensis TaxID=1508375 RepID=A0A941IQ19_9ACTN|nr:hypothetical protein [Actinospica durhamensis]MBR7837165.1 hypothetical protein [Actinospica durhamensis]